MRTTIKDNGDGTMSVTYFYGTMVSISGPNPRVMMFEDEMERVPGKLNEFRIVKS